MKLRRSQRSKFLWLVMASSLFASIAVQAAPSETACKQMRAATFPLTTDSKDQLFIPITIGSRKIEMAVSTTAQNSLLSERAVEMLGLPVDRSRTTIMLMPASPVGFVQLMESIEHNSTNRFVIVRDIDLGGIKPSGMGFFVAPDDLVPFVDGGVLGTDFLQKFDVELDFSGQALNLFSQAHCPEQVVYWTQEPVARIPFDLDAGLKIHFPVQLDGKNMQAVLDIASPITTGGLQSITSDLGIGSDDPALKPLANGAAETYRYPFRTLSFDGVAIQNPDIVLVPSKLHSISGGSSTILLGRNILRRFHLYIAYGEHALYITSAAAH
jgi:hypothetical protein